MRAVIIKKIPIREYDELIVCYTKEEGKQAYQAKSVLLPTSKQAGHLDILNLVDFNLALGNGYPIITSAYCLNSFRLMKASLRAMMPAFFLVELFDKAVMEGERDDKLWDFLVSKLEYLNSEANTINVKECLAGIHGEALEVLGYGNKNDIEFETGRRFNSLQFGQDML
ncbi:MAG: DNA repair protein RecO [bacterium]|nr:DNA repair protein RecO [bacterium]